MIPSGTRFIGFSDSVNLTERRSASVNAETAVYTIDDIRGYKVYTALLTQSGGGDNDFTGPGELTIGVTYMINDSFLGQDFTNVGAPNNDVGTWFVATGTTPNDWGLNQENGLIYYPGAPVVTVLENTIGNIWFTYNDVGSYVSNSNGLFTDYKTVIQMLPEQYIESSTDIYNYQSFPIDVNIIAIGSFFNNDVEDSRLGAFSQNAIEIRVYN